jgi:hypothetical protein
MIGIITEFGKRVSTRWVTAILLPGSLWVIVFGIAVVLGHGSPFDLARLVAETEALGDEFVRHPGRAVVAVVLAVAGAGVAGTVATGLGRLAQRWFLRRRFLTGGLITRSRWSRRSRALAAARRAGVDPVAAYLPQRPTWLGDRVRLVEARVRAQYHVDARLVWPRLWLLLDEDTRRPISDAHARYADAVSLMGWGLLYLVAGVVWWPALLISATVVVTAWTRLRVTVAELAELIESAIDLRLRDLAEAIGTPFGGNEVKPVEGRALDDRLGKAGPA